MATLQERLDAYKKTSGKSGDTRSLAERVQSYKTAGRDNIVSRLNKWFTNNDIFVSNYQKRTAGTTGSYDDKFDSGASSWLETVTNQKNNFDIEARAIKSYLETNRDEFDSEWLDNALKSLSAAQKSQESILAGTKSFNDYWSQWDTEESYNQWAAEMKDREAKLNYDLRAGKAEISRLETISGNASALSKRITELENTLEARRKYAMRMGTTALIDSSKEEAELSALKAEYDSKYKNFNLDELAAEINDKKSYYTLAERMQSAEALKNDAMSAPDFETYAAKGAAIKNPTSKEAEDGVYIFGNRLGGDVEVGNVVTYSRDNYAMMAFGEMNGGGSQYGKSIYHFMFDDEVKVYNYYIGKGDRASADAYLESLTDTLNQRKAGEMYKGIEGNTALEMVFGVAAGLDQFTQGVANLFNGDDYIPTSSTQYLSGMIRENFADNGPNVLGSSLGQIGYDIITTVSNMLPSMLVGGGIGTALLGASAGGNAKSEMLRMGYSKEQATAYGVLVGASEGLLEYAFSGISRIGGKAWQALGKSGIASKVDNILGNISVKAPGIVIALGKTLGGAAGEAFEEGLQSILEPWFKSFVVGGNLEAPNWEEVAYSSLLGALSGGFFEGIRSSVNVSRVSGVGRKIKKAQGVSKLLELGHTYSADSVAYKLAGKINDIVKNGGKVNAYSIGQLFIEEGAMLTEQNVSDLTRGLEELGWDNKSASVTAKAYAQFIDGTIEETEEVKAILSQNAPLDIALIEKLINENTTVYQRTKGYSDLSGMLSKNATSSKTESEAPKNEITEAAPQRDAVDRVYKALNVKGEYGYSEGDGVTLKSSGEAAEVVDVVSTKDGEMKVKLSDGKTVDAKELDFRSEGEALVYETVANLGVDPASAWSIIKNYDPNGEQRGDEYALGAVEAFKYGKIGEKNISSSGFAAKLNESQRKLAYDLGRFSAKNESEARQKRISEIISKIVNKKKASGSLTYDKSVDVSSLREDQKVQIGVLGKVAEGLGVKVRLFESGVDENGKSKFTLEDGTVISDNGWYDPDTGEIWVDVNAGDSRNGLILITSAHELTHFIKDWSPSKYKEFADFLVKTYGESGKSVDEIVRAHMDKSRHDLTYDEAFDEVVARSCESFLMDRDVEMRIVELTQRDKTLAQKIKNFIGQLLAKLKKIADDLGLKPDSEEGRLVSGMTDSLRQLHDLWIDALADAGKSYSKAGSNGEKGKVQFAERDSNASETVIELTADSELVERIENSNRSKYSIIRDYLIEKFYGQTFTLSDGIEAIMDKRDAQELSHLADSRKTAALSNLRDVIEKARFSHKADTVKHNKFDAFRYYSIKVSFNGQIYDILLNVGHSRNKDEYHIYDITNKKRTANQSSTGLSQPVGYAMKSSSSDTIISQPGENVNTQSKKMSERNLDAVTNREVLATALESAAQNDIERKRLAEYKAEVAKYDALGEELRQVRADISAIYNSTGKRDTERLRGLKDRATELANNINTYDKRLLRLEAAAPLRNVIKREVDSVRYTETVSARQKIADARLAGRMAQGRIDAEVIRKKDEQIKAIREQRDRKLEEQKQNFREQKERAAERRDKTSMRNKIRDRVDSLNKLLLNPTKEKHVPMHLQKPVAELLSIVNMEASDNENVKARLQVLKAEYEAIAKSKDPIIAAGYHPEVAERIGNVAEFIGDTALKDMDLEQLDYLYETLTILESVIRKANKGFKIAKGQTIESYAQSTMDEIREVGGEEYLSNTALDALSKYRWNNLKPVYAFERIGSKTFTELFNNVRAGEDVWATDVSEARSFFLENARKYGYFDWDLEKTYSFKDKFGKSFELTLPQMMSLYAYSKRGQADLHLEEGGFVYEDDVKVKRKNGLGIPISYTVKTANTFALRKEHLADVIVAMSEEQRNFVDAMQDYLSTTMGAKGNEVAREMYGIDLFKETNYFPLKSSSYYLSYNPEKDAQAKIKNYGMAKELVKNANNPIVLSDFMKVWGGHVDEMSMYHAFVLPMEDFSKVFNFNTPTSDDAPKKSVQAALKNAYGDASIAYIKSLLTDLNGGARSDPTLGFVNSIISKFKKAKVFLSWSVIVQQPSAIGRAFALINPKYFKPNLKQKHNDAWAELKKYAPVAVIKEMGYFDTNVGQSTVDYLAAPEYRGLREKAKGIFTDENYRDAAMGKLPSLADELTWNYIWQAVKGEIADTTDLEAGSEEFLKAAGARFTEIVTKTQVYDSVLSRSAFMRSKDGLAKMITAFLAEPTTSANMMGNAILQSKRGNKKILAATTAAVATSVAINSVLVSLIRAMRDDDEDETFTEKYVESLVSELLDGINPATYLPIVKDIWSIAQGYDVERTDMSLFADLIAAVETLFNDNKTILEKVEGLSVSGANLAGIPLENVIRDIRSVFNLARVLGGDIDTTRGGLENAGINAVRDTIPFADKLIPKESKSDKLYEAILSGDKNEIKRAEGGYSDKAAITSALRKALRENDARIKAAAQARYDGDISEYKRIAKAIIAEGYFSQDDVVAAINAEINAIKNGATVESDAAEAFDKVTSIFKASDINAALAAGDTDTALSVTRELLSVKYENELAEAKRKAEESGERFIEWRARKDAERAANTAVRKTVTEYWKPLYLEAFKNRDVSEMNRIRKLLYGIGIYGNLSELDKTLAAWKKS